MSGDQRVALVTGANRGIGAAAAAQLARLGYPARVERRGAGWSRSWAGSTRS